MDREALDRYCERGILGVVVAILVLGPLGFGAVRSLEFAVLQALTCIVALLWATRLWLAPRPRLLWPPVCWAVLAFTAYAVVRYLTADVEYVARQEMIRVLVYALLFFAVLNNLHRQESTTIISFTLIFLALAIAGYGIYQYLAESDRVWTLLKPYPHRASGTYICPNHFAGFLEMLLPLALAYTLTGRLKPVTRVVLGYAAVVMVAGIAVSTSRGSWIATLAVMFLFVGALSMRRQHRIPALAVLGILLVGAALFFKQSYYGQLRLRDVVTNRGQLNDGMRFTLWEPAFQMWKENPWFGVGPAHFDIRFRAYRPEAVQLTPDRVHNDYLNTLADWGIVGVVLVLSAWVLLGLGVYKTWRSPRLAAADIGGKSMSNKFAFVLGTSLGLTAILTHSVVDFNMHIPANAILVVTLMALLSAHLRFATERFWFGPRAVIKALVSVLILGATAYLLPQAWRHGAEFVWLDRASRAPSFSPRQVELLRHAHRIEPMNPQTTLSVGEAYRRQSQEGGLSYQGQAGVDYRILAEQAMVWFGKGMGLNPHDSRNYSGYGWCLDWLDRPSEAEGYFDRAEQLDPNNYFNLNNIGMHYVQSGNFAAAKPWFERSLALEWQFNDTARNYLRIIQGRMAEAATNGLSARIWNATQ